MPDRNREVEVDAIPSVYGFLLEQPFLLTCDDRPDPQEALRQIVSSLEDILKRSVADPHPTDAKDVGTVAGSSNRGSLQ